MTTTLPTLPTPRARRPSPPTSGQGRALALPERAGARAGAPASASTRLRSVLMGGLRCALLWALLALAGPPAAANPLQPELEALQAFDQASAEIKARRFDRAEILLERVLMLQPEHAEARIELALLMAARGLQDSARALVQSLIDDPRTEAAQARELRNLLALIQKPQPQQPGLNPYSLNAPARAQSAAPHAAQTSAQAPSWRGEVSLGHSTNPMARTSADAITITLPDGPLSLPLAQAERAGLTTGVHLSRSSASGGLELALQGTSVTDASTAARAVAWARLPLPSHADATRPTVLAYAQAQRGLDGQHRSQIGLSALSGAQKYTLSSYQELGVRDRGLIWRLEHQSAPLWGSEWQALLERSKSTTGPQGYWRLGLSGEYPLNDRARLQFQWLHQNDTYEYSSLLENGARRRLGTVHVAFEQRHTLDHEKTLVWRVFTGERRSNLSLFDYQEAGLQLSLVKKWP